MAEIQKLEYFNAAWKESKRCNPPAPLGDSIALGRLTMSEYVFLFQVSPM